MAKLKFDAAADAAAIMKGFPQEPEVWLNYLLDRALMGSPLHDRQAVLAGIEAFDRERLSRVPAAAKYPEAGPWAEHVLAVDRQLAELGLSARLRAIWRSHNDYLTFRGIRGRGRPPQVERCRVAYVPDTEVGQFHIKNVDDPIKYWKPSTQRPDFDVYTRPLVWDGTGSGLHIDQEPTEIFPLPVHDMCMTYCTDVPGAVEFLTRYGSFWGRANCVLRDRQKRSVAIEKCSYSFIAVHWPDASGISHCSGMVCRDPQSAIAKHQTAMRKRYVEVAELGPNSSDQVFWDAAVGMEHKLASFLRTPEARQSQKVIDLFTTPVNQGGLRKDGGKRHPKQEVEEFTLCIRAAMVDRRRFLFWQRGTDARMPDEPQVFDYPA